MRFLLGTLLILDAPWLIAGQTEIESALSTIKAVGKEGSGNGPAAMAWKTLAAEGMPAFVPTLAAFKDASPIAANWLRSTIDAIVAAETKAGRTVTNDTLKGFVQDAKQSPDARRIAFELLNTQSPDLAKDVLKGMIDDPSLDLRRDAIALRMKAAGKDDTKALDTLYTAARDRDQVEALAKLLGKGSDDVTTHFNYITRWHVAGPFDGPDASGFAKSYEPESKVDLKATYEGKAGAKVAWKTVSTKELAEDGGKDYSLVDLVKEVGKHKDAVAYAFAVIDIEKETAVDLRAATQNAVKMYLNGKEVFAREAYHQGTMMDQHQAKVTLKAGKNDILLKICQNDQKEPWAQRWVFQMRVCDFTGGRVPMTVVSPEAK